MSVRYRPMRLKDVPQCANLVAGHAISGPRYGNAIADLAPAWRRLLCCNGFASTAVFEEVGGAAPRLLGIGISVFITDRFLRELKTPPYFWIGPELAKRVAQGDHSPLLSDKQIKEANSRGGLNLAVWHGCVRVEDMRLAEVYKEVMTAFLTEHRGFLVKELVAHGETPEHLEGMRNTGGFLLKPDGCYGDFEGKSSHDIISRPHVIGITRAMALKQHGSWVGSLFMYQPPRLGFSGSEQRLLLSALAGGTDEDLSGDLGVSLSTVKKTWRSAYDRVAACLPELIPSDSTSDDETRRRGKNKRQPLLAYLREHPEELRPVSRKLLQPSATPSRLRVRESLKVPFSF